MKTVELVADGSCIGNPGPGGWACILRNGNQERELSGSEAQTTKGASCVGCSHAHFLAALAEEEVVVSANRTCD